MKKIKLKEVCAVNPKDNIEDLDMTVSFVPMQKVTETGDIDVSEERIAKEVIKGFTSFVDGDVLMAKITPCMENGKGAIAKGLRNNRGFGSTEFLVIRPDANKVCSDWVYYYTVGKKFRKDCERNMTGSAGQKRVPKTYIENCLIPVLSMEEQRNLVDSLNKAKTIIKLRKQELQKLDDLIKARFVEMFGDPMQNPFGWEKETLSKIITSANNGMARRGNDEEGNIVLRLVELKDGFIDYSKTNRIALTTDEKRRYLLREKDFLFARVNGNPENVGRCATFHEIGEPVYHNDHIIRVHFDDSRLEGTFASALLNSEYGKRQLKNQIKTSAGQYTVRQEGIGAIVAFLPPIKLQKQFADFVHQVNESKASVQKALDETQLLFDSLMQKYFG